MKLRGEESYPKTISFKLSRMKERRRKKNYGDKIVQANSYPPRQRNLQLPVSLAGGRVVVSHLEVGEREYRKEVR